MILLKFNWIRRIRHSPYTPVKHPTAFSDSNFIFVFIQHRCFLTAMTFTKVVFPEYCKPTSVNSISSFQNKLLNQSKILLIKANILLTLLTT